ncbi:MAG: sulfur carrier protein ThiS [Anaerolineaceae bacterium]
MIKVNSKDHPWRSGLTVHGLLEEKQYIFRQIVVRINGKYVPEEAYASQKIQDGDDVLVLHLMAGG